jgi:hypothetical protein
MQIFLGAREADTDIDYLKAIVELARQTGGLVDKEQASAL